MEKENKRTRRQESSKGLSKDAGTKRSSASLGSDRTSKRLKSATSKRSLLRKSTAILSENNGDTRLKTYMARVAFLRSQQWQDKPEKLQEFALALYNNYVEEGAPEQIPALTVERLSILQSIQNGDLEALIQSPLLLAQVASPVAPSRTSSRHISRLSMRMSLRSRRKTLAGPLQPNFFEVAKQDMDLKSFSKDGFLDAAAAELARTIYQPETDKAAEKEQEEAKEKEQQELEKEKEKEKSSLGLNWKFEDSLLTYLPPAQEAPTAPLLAFNFAALMRATAFDKDHYIHIFDNCKEKLEQAQDCGHQIVIFANQPEIGRASSEARRKLAVGKVQARLQELMGTLARPIEIFVAGHKAQGGGESDRYRLPGHGLWDLMIKTHSAAPDMESSFFIGDSAEDKQFAGAVGLTFMSAKEFFSDKE